MKNGDQVSYLTLIEFYNGYWKCQCICGKIVFRYSYQIKQSKIQSCGCKHPRHLTGKNSKNWKGFGDIPATYYDSLKLRANSRNLEWNITIEDMWHKFIEQNSRCALTDLELKFSTQKQQKKGKEQTASLDRINSNKGYTLDNIMWVHKDVNKMKNNYPLNRFIEICKLITNKYV